MGQKAHLTVLYGPTVLFKRMNWDEEKVTTSDKLIKISS